MGVINVPAAPESAWQRVFLKRRLAVFTFLFFLIAFALLALYRFLIPTILNQAYLYSVARSTCWVLGFVGHSCEVERPALYAGREREVRRMLNPARGTGGQAGADDFPDRAEPLSSWEVYRFRTLRLAHESEVASRMVTELSRPFEAVIVDSPAEHVAAVRFRLQRLQEILREGGAAENRSLADPQVMRELSDFDVILEDLGPRARAPSEPFVQRLAEVDRRLDDLRLRQMVLVSERAARLRESISSLGPTVNFTACISIEARLRELRARLAEMDGGDAASNAPVRALRSWSLRRAIQRLERRREDVITQGKTARLERDAFFAFVVAPECGAIEVFALYAAAVLAFPCAIRKRIIGIGFGLPMLYGINVLRLACLAWIGALDVGRQAFLFSHEYVWQGVYVAVVAVVWLAWIELALKTNGRRASGLL